MEQVQQITLKDTGQLPALGLVHLVGIQETCSSHCCSAVEVPRNCISDSLPPFLFNVGSLVLTSCTPARTYRHSSEICGILRKVGLLREAGVMTALPGLEFWKLLAGEQQARGGRGCLAGLCVRAEEGRGAFSMAGSCVGALPARGTRFCAGKGAGLTRKSPSLHFLSRSLP